MSLQRSLIRKVLKEHEARVVGDRLEEAERHAAGLAPGLTLQRDERFAELLRFTVAPLDVGDFADGH